MSLINRMEQELKQAMLDKESERRDALRLLLASLRSAEKELQRRSTGTATSIVVASRATHALRLLVTRPGRLTRAEVDVDACRFVQLFQIKLDLVTRGFHLPERRRQLLQRGLDLHGSVLLDRLLHRLQPCVQITARPRHSPASLAAFRRESS